MPDTPLNRTAYAILGLLTLGSKSGYDIKQDVETKISHFWKESFGHIYPILKRLHSLGLVEMHTEPGQNAPSRHVYTLTEAGRAALHGWLAEPTEVITVRNELLLKLFFGTQAPVAVNRRQVEAQREQHTVMLRVYEETARQFESAAAAQDTYYLITLRAGIHYCQAMLAWCDETLARLEKLPES